MRHPSFRVGETADDFERLWRASHPNSNLLPHRDIDGVIFFWDEAYEGPPPLHAPPGRRIDSYGNIIHDEPQVVPYVIPQPPPAPPTTATRVPRMPGGPGAFSLPTAATYVPLPTTAPPLGLPATPPFLPPVSLPPTPPTPPIVSKPPVGLPTSLPAGYPSPVINMPGPVVVPTTPPTTAPTGLPISPLKPPITAPDTASTPMGATSPPRPPNLLRDVLTFVVLTSPAWVPFLLLRTPARTR